MRKANDVSVDLLAKVREFVRSMDIPEAIANKFVKATSVEEAMAAMAEMPGEAYNELFDFMASIAGEDLVIERPLDEVTYLGCGFGSEALSRLGDVFLRRCHTIPVPESSTEEDPIVSLINSKNLREARVQLARLSAEELETVAPIVEEMNRLYGN